MSRRLLVALALLLGGGGGGARAAVGSLSASLALLEGDGLISVMRDECEEWSSKCTCTGSDSGDSDVHSDGRPYTRLSAMYANCTHVHGNVIIAHVLEADMLAEGHAPVLDFLDRIEEITGFLMIKSNKLPAVSLPRLKIIWGDTLYKPAYVPDQREDASNGYSLYVFDNKKGFHNISLPSLRGIENGDVYVGYNDHVCHWSKVDWRQLFGNDTSRHVISEQNHLRCGPADGICNETCSKGRCWAGGADDCQLVYRDACPCRTGMCYNEKGGCCHSMCAGGCVGPLNTDCIVSRALSSTGASTRAPLQACQGVVNDGECVNSCPPLRRLDHATNRLVDNAVGRYQYDRRCLRECPAHTLVEDGRCVSRCSEGHAVTIEQPRECRECVDVCQKTCEIRDDINSRNIHLLTNCTIVEGYISILGSSFDDSNFHALNGATDTTVMWRGLELDDLKLLKDVQTVSGFVFIHNAPKLTDLNFLPNLHAIYGRRLTTLKFALEISTNQNLRVLGLRSLRQVLGGPVGIRENNDLCLADTLPWLEISQHDKVPIVTNNRDAALCREEGFACDEHCLNGCWGNDDAALCFDCQHFLLDGRCVDTCQSDGLYVSAPKMCERCDEQCVTCAGPGAFNCTRCRGVQLDGECVSACPANRFSNAGVCEECHRHCDQMAGCSGKANHAGAGGCNRCLNALAADDSHSLLRCLGDESTVCAEMNDTHATDLSSFYSLSPTQDKRFYDSVDNLVCYRCHRFCKSCTSYGTSVEEDRCICTNRTFVDSAERQLCVVECPKESYEDTESGLCIACHVECADGCSGPLPSDCVNCRHLRDSPDDALFNCTAVCPPHRQHVYKGSCSATDLRQLEIDEQKRNQLIIAAVIGALFLLLLAVAVGLFSYRRKWSVQKKLNLPTLDDDVASPSGKPNMARLRLIKRTELRLGGQLGSGAFGVVYKGVWLPEGEHVRVPVAIKEVQEVRGAAEQEMIEEAGMMAGMEHKHLLRLVGVCLSSRILLVTPLMPLGNLLDYVQQNKSRISSSVLLRWCEQIAEGMEALERARLVHRDLAARNVLVQNPVHVRVTDFGLAKMLEPGETDVYVEGRVPIKWLALECIRFRRFTHKSDVWAFGVTVWELLTYGGKPFGNVPIAEIPDMLERGERLDQPTTCSMDLYLVLIKCWMVEADSRPSFRDLVHIFDDMSRDASRYVVISNDKLMRLPTFTSVDQTELMRGFLDDLDDADLIDPVDYFDPGDSTPRTPLSPTSALKQPVRRSAARRHSAQRAAVQLVCRDRASPARHTSVGSSRYQSEPVNRCAAQPSRDEAAPSFVTIGADDYLVPNQQRPTDDDGAASYTLVTAPTRTPERAPPCRQPPPPRADKKPPHASNVYYNALQNVVSVAPPALDNSEYMNAGKAADEVSQSETTV